MAAITTARLPCGSRSKPTSQMLVPASSFGSGWRWMPWLSWTTRTNGSLPYASRRIPRSARSSTALSRSGTCAVTSTPRTASTAVTDSATSVEPRLLDHLGGVPVPGRRERAHRAAAVGVVRRGARLRAGGGRPHLGVDDEHLRGVDDARPAPAAAARGSRRWRRTRRWPGGRLRGCARGRPPGARRRRRRAARGARGCARTSARTRPASRRRKSAERSMTSGAARAQLVDDPLGLAVGQGREHDVARRQLVAGDEAQRGAAAQHRVRVVHVPAAQPLARRRHHVRVRVRDEQAQQLAAGVPGGADHRDAQAAHRSPSQRAAQHRRPAAQLVDCRSNSCGAWSSALSPGPYTAAPQRHAGQTTLRSHVPVLVV